ncbi:MAG: hypothetical protein RRX92_07765 [Lachnospiraceae bacterium]
MTEQEIKDSNLVEEDAEKENSHKDVPPRLRDNLYSKIDIPVSTMNWVIGIIVVAIVVFLVYGIWKANF